LRYGNVGLYAADQWRVAPSLTLNFGLRYDLFTPLRNANLVLLEPILPNNSDPVAAILNPNGSYGIVGTNVGEPGQLFKTDKIISDRSSASPGRRSLKTICSARFSATAER
jgi:outer membrane receptor protein involved in Fe transport